MVPTFPLTWPTKLLAPTTPRIAMQSQSKSGGQSVTGVEQVVRSPAMRWAITLSNIPIRTAAQTLAWRAIEAALDGRAGTILVPIYDWLRAPAGRAAILPFADGTRLADGSGFQTPRTNVVLQQDEPLNATQIPLTWTGPAPTAGDHFSIGTGAQTELHRISAITPTGDGPA